MSYSADKKSVRLIPWILLSMLISVLFAAPVYGQDLVKYEIDKTDQVLDRVRQSIEESGSPQAGEYLEKAYALQEKAKDSFQRRRYQNAHRLTTQARELATKAIAFVRQNNEDRELVEKELEKTQEMLELLQEQTGRSELARSLLENALAVQKKARDLYLRNRQKMAMAATLKARDMISLSLEQVRETSRIKREIEKTDQYLERMQAALAKRDLEEARPGVEKALKAQEEARSLFERGEYQLALAKTKTARDFISEALKYFEKRLQDYTAEKAIANLEKRYAELSEIQVENPNDIVEKLLQQALDEYTQGRDAYREGKVERAFYHLKRSDKFLAEAAEILKPY